MIETFRMLHPLSHATLLAACLMQTACFLVSDEEIRVRIAQALPLNAEIHIDNIDKSITCIAVIFSVPSLPNISGTENRSTASGLGQIWHSATSFYDYSESIEQEALMSIVSGTVIQARPCMEGTDFSTDMLYSDQIMITRSNSGKELLMIFDQTEPLFGIYLAQGR